MTYSENEHPGPSFSTLLWLRMEQQKIRAKEKMLKCGVRRSTADRVLGWKITTVAMIVATLLVVGFVAMWLLIALVVRAVMKNQDRDM